MEAKDPTRLGIPQTVKSRVEAAWHSVRYGKNIFQSKTNFSEQCPVWLLGVPYSRRKQDQDGDKSEFEAFLRDYESRIWFSYRKDVPLFPSTQLTSDAGWGCMLRSAQMLMAQALMLHTLGRQWRLIDSKDPNNLHDLGSDEVHRQILKFFSESEPRRSAPFSIHNLVQLSHGLGKSAGNWFGPATAAYLLQMAWLSFAQDSDEIENSILNDLGVYVAQDCTVYKEDIISICTGQYSREVEGFALLDKPIASRSSLQSTGESDEMKMKDLEYSFSEEVTPESCSKFSGGQQDSWQSLPNQESCLWRSAVILVPIRIGGDKLNLHYAHCLKNLLTLPCCLGWIGGKPSHSLYFIGFQDDHLIHLDPHRVQGCVDTANPEFATKSFHSNNPRKVSISKMDPSCCLGFYLRTRDEFESWCLEIEQYVTPLSQPGTHAASNSTSSNISQYPLFTVQHKSTQSTGLQQSSVQHEEWVEMDSEENSSTECGITSEDFVFL